MGFNFRKLIPAKINSNNVIRYNKLWNISPSHTITNELFTKYVLIITEISKVAFDFKICDIKYVYIPLHLIKAIPN